ALIAAGIVMTAIGALLPRRHIASRSLRSARTPAEIWTAFREATAASSVPVDVVEQDPPRRLVTRVKESEKMFGGTWTAVIEPAASGATLTVTEDGWVANPLFRFISRFVIGHHATIDATLKDVAKRLNEPPAISGQ